MGHSLIFALLSKFVLLPSYLLVLLVRMLKWLVAPLALLAQLLIGVPLALLRIRQPLRPRFVPLSEADLPDAAWITLSDTSDSLAAEGFGTYGDFRCDELIQGAVLWLRFMGQPESGVGALAAHVEIKTGARPVRRFVEFSTEFRDGRVLDTNNLDLPYSLPAPVYLARVQLKDVWDPRALFALHRDLVASLAGTINLESIERAARDPTGLLADSCAREIRALVAEGWLTLDAAHGWARLRPWAALMGVWRQAWPLASLYLRASDRRSRRLLAEHGLDADQFSGGAMAIEVSRRPLEISTPISTVRAGYEQVLPLARHTDAHAVLEAVVVELDRDEAETPVPREFRFSFRGYDDQPSRRIRRFRSFDILLDPVTGTLAVTAVERECERAASESDWAKLIATPPWTPLRLDPWLRDLDSVLPVARAALASRTAASDTALDSASLFIENERPCWQLVAWTEDGTALHVMLDARSGSILNP